MLEWVGELNLTTEILYASEMNLWPPVSSICIGSDAEWWGHPGVLTSNIFNHKSVEVVDYNKKVNRGWDRTEQGGNSKTKWTKQDESDNSESETKQ